MVEHDQGAARDFVDFDLSLRLKLSKRDSDAMSIDIVLFQHVCQHSDNQILS